MEQELINLLIAVRQKWGNETVEAIKKKLSEGAQTFTGELEQSIGFDAPDNLDGNYIFDMVDYGSYLDQGVQGFESNFTSQFRYAGNWKGMAQALKPWADSKGLNPFAVAWSMQQKGLEPRRFFNSVIESRIDLLGEQLTVAMADYLNDMVNKQQRT